MTQPTREEAFDALLREAAAWRLRQALAALPSEECLRAEYGPLHRLDRRVRRSVRALQKAQQRRVLNRTSRRKMRRILLAAALLLGSGLFVFRFVKNGGRWVSFAANRHLYNRQGQPLA